MGSPLVSLTANAFLHSIEEKLEHNNKMAKFYKWYIDDSLARVCDKLPATKAFSSTLNDCHLAIDFTMVLGKDNKLLSLGMQICKTGCQLTTMVYHKPTNTGVVLHYQSHMDQRYQRSLLKTMMLSRAYHLSSLWELFTKECELLKGPLSTSVLCVPLLLYHPGNRCMGPHASLAQWVDISIWQKFTFIWHLASRPWTGKIWRKQWNFLITCKWVSVFGEHSVYCYVALKIQTHCSTINNFCAQVQS